MKKFLMSILLVMVFFLVSCKRNSEDDLATTSTQVSSAQSETITEKETSAVSEEETSTTTSEETSAMSEEETSAKPVVETSTTTPENDSTAAIFTQITRIDIIEMIENNATFDELKDKYSLSIDGELAYLITKSGSIPNAYFYFKKDEITNEYKIEYIDNLIVSMVLPEYVDMAIDQIPIVLTTISDYGVILDDGDLNYNASLSRPGILSGNDWVSVGRQY